jgi:hypothetical protein
MDPSKRSASIPPNLCRIGQDILIAHLYKFTQFFSAILRQQQIQRIRGDQQQISQSSNEDMDPRAQMVFEDEEEGGICMERAGGGRGGEGQQIGQQQKGGSGQVPMMSAKEMKERKKSLMTRLIPGRNGPNGKMEMKG